MTGMLASVSSPEEAKIVLEQKVDIIDLKNPKNGALGALDLDIIDSIVGLVKKNIPISATIGDIEPNDIKLEEYIFNISRMGVNFVKVGLFEETIPDRFVEIIDKCGKKDINIIIVIFAENISDISLLESLMKINIKGIMIDTKNKSSKNLCSIMRYEKLEKFVKLVKSYNLLSGLAGSLKYEDIEKLLSLRPDYLGFRGALCTRQNRVESIDSNAVKRIRDIIAEKKSIYNENIIHKEVIVNGSVA